MRTQSSNKRAGILLTVIILAAILSFMVVGLLSESGSNLVLSQRQVNREQALFLAETGMERAVAYLIANWAIPIAITGSISNGYYETLIRFANEAFTGTNQAGVHKINGEIKINPNSQTNNEFFLIKPGGKVITRLDLVNDRNRYAATPCVFYEGPAVFIHVKPGGAGSQSSFYVDGSLHSILNNKAHAFESTGIHVKVYNDACTAGKPSGHWIIGDISSHGVSIDNDGSASAAKGIETYAVVSKGAMAHSSRVVHIDGLHQRSWAKYALWYNSDTASLALKGGEKFNGPVHANTKFKFVDDPEFFDTCSSTASGYDGSIEHCNFHKGLTLNAHSNSLLSIDFTILQNNAGMTLEGRTHIRLGISNMAIINTRKGWTNWHTNTLPANGLLYIKNSNTSLSETRKGDVYISGSLGGRLTVASEYDIYITNHIRYVNPPTNALPSNDALGLLAMRNVLVTKSCPSNLNIFAHIIASGKATPTDSSDGQFTVTNYDSTTIGPRGDLNVYGGIVQDRRGPVGTFNSTSGKTLSGYTKKYTYDTRFADKPPPFYPTLTNEYTWKAWREVAQ